MATNHELLDKTIPPAAKEKTPPLDTHRVNDELVGAIYLVVGQGTEGGSASYRLSIAGITLSNTKDQSWGEQSQVAGDSGYSIGAIQVDLGKRGEWVVGAVENQRPKEGEMAYVDAIISAASAYAQAHKLPFAEDHKKLRADLLSHGHDKFNNGKKTKDGLQFIDTDTRDSINAWAGSEEGKKWIHQNIDLPQARNITKIAIDTLSAYAKKDFKEEERFESLSLIAKSANQRPRDVNRELRGVLQTGGGYAELLQEAHQIKMRIKWADSPKDGEIGKKYEEAFADASVAAKLHAAQKKVSSADYNPATQNTDADVKFAVGLVKNGGVLKLSKDDTIKMQANLIQLGYKGVNDKPLKADGNWGANTRHAFGAFQKAQGLTEQGGLYTKTRQALEEAVSKQQQENKTKQQEPAKTQPGTPKASSTDSRFPGQPQLASFSEKIAAAFPQFDTEQNARLTAYWANRCVREGMPVESVGRMVSDRHQDGRQLLHAINQEETQVVTANMHKALDTPVEQSLAKLQQAQLPHQEQAQQQMLAQQQTQAAVMRM